MESDKNSGLLHQTRWISQEDCSSKSDKNEELLPQTLLGTVRVSFKTYRSCRPLS